MKEVSDVEKQLWNEFFNLDEVSRDKLDEILATIPPYERQMVWHELNRREYFAELISALLKRLADE